MRLGTRRGIGGLSVSVSLLTLTFVSSPWCMAASLADFTRCISPQGQGPVCQLDAGDYQLQTPFAIGRSNLTIKGTFTKSLADTTLRRAPGSTRALIAAYDRSPNLAGITIRDFTFDGGGARPDADSIETDVRMISVKSLLITNCAFINSPLIALGLGGNLANGYTSGAVINNVSIDNVGKLGLIALTKADSPGRSLTCGSDGYSSNIVIANSTFKNVGANAIYLEAQRVQVINNTAQHNHFTSPYNAPGGQFAVGICADDIAMVNNRISDAPIAPNGFQGEGIELHGTNLMIVDNTITNNAGNGINMSGVQHVFIANWKPGTGVSSNNVGAGYVAGISLYTPVHYGTSFGLTERPVDGITIDHAVSVDGRLAGIGVFLKDNQMTPINHVTITNNCLAGNLQGPTNLSGLGPAVRISNNLSAGCP